MLLTVFCFVGTLISQTSSSSHRKTPYCTNMTSLLCPTTTEAFEMGIVCILCSCIWEVSPFLMVVGRKWSCASVLWLVFSAFQTLLLPGIKIVEHGFILMTAASLQFQKPRLRYDASLCSPKLSHSQELSLACLCYEKAGVRCDGRQRTQAFKITKQNGNFPCLFLLPKPNNANRSPVFEATLRSGWIRLVLKELRLVAEF